MYDVSTRRQTLALVSQGRSLNSVSRETGISRAAIRSWQSRLEPLPRMAPPDPGPPADECAYAYLLGLYLGDGCISPHSRGTGYYLRIACADAWPGLIELCRDAITKVRPAVRVYLMQKEGCTMVTSYSRHWPVLFPQHGPGKKHERTIALEPWQQTIVATHPWEFIRGLIHSDGCRITNWTTRLVAGEPQALRIPPVLLHQPLGGHHPALHCSPGARRRRMASGEPRNISVARKASVALMDAHVGPKH